MATAKETVKFFTHGTCEQYEQVLKMYPQALKLKADRKAKKPEELIKLDDWYQNELPKKIKARGKDAHMIHEELVQTMKWKQIRGKFYPQLSYLVKVNTPRMVIQETKKAFRKLPNLEQAITALGNLKGVGTTMASALLAAACPESAPFMADECLMAIPDVEGIDYTTKEYLKFAQHIDSVSQRLNLDAERIGSSMQWSPHKVELALWTHYVVSELKPELLDGIQMENGTTSIPPALAALHQNGDSLDADATITSDESNSAGGVPPINGKSTALTTGDLDDDTRDVTGAFVNTNKGFPAPVNGKAKVGSALSAAVLDEDTRDATASFTDTENGSPTVDDLCENSASTSSVSESTKDSIQDEDSNSSPYTGKRSFNNTSTINGPPAAKKVRTEAK